MAGKLDSIAHAAAIARIGEATKHESDVLRHVDEIVKGPAFKGSPRSQAFLIHVVEKALHGDSEDLRERSIGIALFERPAAYDTADDAIVRVTASDVRKRLLQHYGNTRTESKIRIGLPPGSYVPEFSFSISSALSPRESPSAIAPLGNPSVAERPPAGVRFGWRKAVLIALLVLPLAGASWWTVGRRLGYPASKENLIQAAFQGAPSPTQVVVADDALVLIQVLLDHRFTLLEYENLAYLQAPDFVREKDLQRFWGSLSSRQITNAGDLQNANRIVADLRARNWDVTIRLARQMHARAFRNGNFVILGSSFSNPWAALFPVEDSNFPYEALPRPGKPEVILNRHPLQGEPAKFEVHKDAKTGETITYARVYLVENLARSGRVLLVAGQSMSATEMAGEVLLRDDFAAKVRNMLAVPASGRLPDLEMVLQVSEQNEIGNRAELVSARKIARHSD
jgi:hypothetical protein